MDTNRALAVASLLQVLMLIGLMIHFIQTNNSFFAYLIGAGIALSGLIMIIPMLINTRK